MRAYRIMRSCRPHGAGHDSERFWQQAEVAPIVFFPWYQTGARWIAEARVLYDDEALYWRISTTGDHAIVGRYTKPNDPVCRDSCAEFFLQTSTQPGAGYLNFEINCVGTMLLFLGAGRHGRLPVGDELASQVSIRHSVVGPTKAEAHGDDAWHVEASVPLDVLAEMTGCPRPARGTEWRGNFYRCADDSSNPQWSCWNLVETDDPDFHRPEYFGRLLFG